MNRPIKFRVWDKHHKQWIGACAIELDGTIIDIHNAIPETNCIAQQYTGLKDTNGKEIFEGDILNCDLVGGDDPQTVIFKDGIFTLDYLTPGCYNLYDEINQMVRHKVIGNIFENSELLK